MRCFAQVLPDCYIDRDMVVAFRRIEETVVVGFLDADGAMEQIKHDFGTADEAMDWFDHLAVLLLP